MKNKIFWLDKEDEVAIITDSAVLGACVKAFLCHMRSRERKRSFHFLFLKSVQQSVEWVNGSEGEAR